MRHSKPKCRPASKAAKPVTAPPPPSARWESPELRAAAAEYCAEQIPPPPRLDSPEGKRWCLRCAVLFSLQLDIHPPELADILREYRPPAPAACPLLRAESELAALLPREDCALRSDEKEELVSILERSPSLTEAQRLTVTRLIRGGSPAGSRADSAETLHGVLNWLCPETTVPVWRVHRQHATLRTPCRVEILPAPLPLDTPHHTLKRQHVRLTEEETGRVLVFLHASACPATSRTRNRRAFTVRSLYPAGRLYDDAAIRRNLTLLLAYLYPGPRPGAAWAGSMGRTRPPAG